MLQAATSICLHVHTLSVTIYFAPIAILKAFYAHLLVSILFKSPSFSLWVLSTFLHSIVLIYKIVLAYLWMVSRRPCSNQPGQPHTNEDFNGIALSCICHHALQQQEHKWICLAVTVHSKLGSVGTELNSLKVCLLRHRQHLLLQLCFFFLYILKDIIQSNYELFAMKRYVAFFPLCSIFLYVNVFLLQANRCKTDRFSLR